jgi:hypothetical protein
VAQADFDERVLRSYAAQVYLRKRWYEICDLYNLEGEPLSEPYILHAESALRDFRTPEFSMSEPSASDGLFAQVRARYWSVWGMIYRPFVRSVLELNGSNLAHEITPTIHQRAVLGVMAMVQNTRSFHGSKASVTNPFEMALE